MLGFSGSPSLAPLKQTLCQDSPLVSSGFEARFQTILVPTPKEVHVTTDLKGEGKAVLLDTRTRSLTGAASQGVASVTPNLTPSYKNRYPVPMPKTTLVVSLGREGEKSLWSPKKLSPTISD
jgi:hypothetical protein